MSLSSLFDRFFDTEEEGKPKPEKQAWADGSEPQAVASAIEHPYVKSLLDWLADKALEPLPVTSGVDSVAGAASRNAYLEVRKKIQRDARRAEEFLSQARAGRD